MLGFKKEKIKEVQIDYGIIYTNYGETDQTLLAPIKGGGAFKATKTIRDIEFDGSGTGKHKGNQIIESIDASLSVTSKDSSIPNMAQAMLYVTLSGDGSTTPYKVTCDASSLGLISDDKYLKNITMFCKVVNGGYRKITIYNAMNENDFEFGAVPKGEGEIQLEYFGHWDIEDDIADASKLFEIEDITEIAAG